MAAQFKAKAILLGAGHFLRQGERLLGPLQGLVRAAQKPQNPGYIEQADHPGVMSSMESLGAVLLGIVEENPQLQRAPRAAANSPRKYKVIPDSTWADTRRAGSLATFWARRRSCSTKAYVPTAALPVQYKRSTVLPLLFGRAREALPLAGSALSLGCTNWATSGAPSPLIDFSGSPRATCRVSSCWARSGASGNVLQRFSGGCDSIATMPKPAENIVVAHRREGFSQCIK